MPMYSDLACQARADNYCARLNNGYFRGYNGTPPANVAAALSGNTMLIENRFAATAFPPATGHGNTTSNPLTVVNAVASGIPTFYRGYASDGTTCVAQWNTTDVTISPASVTAGVSITVNPMVHTEAVGS